MKLFSLGQLVALVCLAVAVAIAPEAVTEPFKQRALPAGLLCYHAVTDVVARLGNPSPAGGVSVNLVDHGTCEAVILGLEEQIRQLERASAQLGEVRLQLAEATGGYFPLAVPVILHSDPLLTAHALTLDVGADDGIRPLQAVLSGSTVVGRIARASANSSTVLLTTDPQFRASAITMDARAQGIIKGAGRSTLRLRFISADAGIQVGEAVLTSGQDGHFPKGFKLGVITSIGDADQNKELDVEVTAGMTGSHLEFVTVLRTSP